MPALKPAGMMMAAARSPCADPAVGLLGRVELLDVEHRHRAERVGHLPPVAALVLVDHEHPDGDARRAGRHVRGTLLGQAEQRGEHEGQQEQDRQQAAVVEGDLELLPGDGQRGADRAHLLPAHSNSKRQAPMTKNAAEKPSRTATESRIGRQPLAAREQVVEAGHCPVVRRRPGPASPCSR